MKGSGNRISETRETGDFTGIRLSGSMDVYITKADRISVEIEGDDNIVPLVETYVNDGSLRIKYKDHYSIRAKKSVQVHIGMPELTEAVVTGSGDVKGEGLFSTDEKVKVQVTGSGDIELQLDAPEVKASVTGSGDIRLSGNTKDIDCSTTGSGTIKAENLKAENAKARTSGSGDITVFGSLKIDAGITGSGSIKYTGGGTVSSKITGSGSVRPLN